MKYLLTLSLSLYSIMVIGQSKKEIAAERDSILSEFHISAGEPVFYEEPLLEFSKELKGWTFSQDEKWIEAEQLLPLYGLSTDKKLHTSNEAETGEDNTSSMAFYRMTIDSNEFLIYTKTYRSGKYKYPITRKGWSTKNNFYYCIFRRPSELPVMDSLELDTNLNYGYRLFDERLIEDVGNKAKKPWKLIEQKMYLEPTDRKFVLQLERKSNGQLRFLTYSIHPIFDDPLGIAKDWKIRNKSIYAAKETLNKLHYTVLEEEWSETILP